VIGSTNSGKSTLINAFVKRGYLKQLEVQRDDNEKEYRDILNTTAIHTHTHTHTHTNPTHTHTHTHTHIQTGEERSKQTIGFGTYVCTHM